jgi:hypothetical protein
MTAPVVTLESIAERLEEVLARLGGTLPEYLSVGGAADYCSLCERSIRGAIAAGKLAVYRPVPGRLLIARRELDDWVRQARGARMRRGRGIRQSV